MPCMFHHTPGNANALTVILRMNIYRRILAIHRIENQRRVETLGIGRGKAGVPTTVPLHRRAHAVTVAEVNIVSHPNLIAVVNDGSPGKRHQHSSHEFNPSPVIIQKGRKPPPNPEVQAHRLVASVGIVHVIAFEIGHHLQRKFVVVA